MKKEVLETSCDNCGFKVEEAVDSKKESTLPNQWMHVSGFRNKGIVFELDMCPECTLMVLAAAGKAPASTKAKK